MIAFDKKKALAYIPFLLIFACLFFITLSYFRAPPKIQIFNIPLNSTSQEQIFDAQTKEMPKEVETEAKKEESHEDPQHTNISIGPEHVGFILKLPGHMTTALLEPLLEKLPHTTGFLLSPNMLYFEQVAAFLAKMDREVILYLPMETQTFPKSDDGAHTLMTTLSFEENLKRLKKILHQVSDIRFIYISHHTKFLNYPQQLEALLSYLVKQKVHLIAPVNSPDNVLVKKALAVEIPLTFLDMSIETPILSHKQLREFFDQLVKSLHHRPILCLLDFHKTLIEKYLKWKKTQRYQKTIFPNLKNFLVKNQYVRTNA